MNDTKTTVPVHRFTVALWNHPIAEARSDGTVVITTQGRAFLRERGLVRSQVEVCAGVRRLVRKLSGPNVAESIDFDTGLRVTRLNA